MDAPSVITGPSMPRGRDRFRRFRFAIDVLTAGLSVLPVRVRRGLWQTVEGWHGLHGVGARYCLLKTLAKSCGENVFVGPHVEIRGWEGLVVGDNVSIHRGCYFDARGGIHIGQDVSIAHASSVLSFEHTWDDLTVPIRDNPLRFAPVVIDDDVWVGCGVRLLAGVQIGTRSIIAAGAVVTRDIRPWSIAGGVPARVLRSISAELSVGTKG
jgi:acetyltransferase-like isoleucine patch superfamily enzyme